MIKYFATTLLLLVIILSSCKEVQEKPSTEQLLKEIEEAESKVSEQEDPISFWKNMLNQKRYASDRVASANINAKIGTFFGRQNLDSAEFYGTRALILLEDIEGFENLKIYIYNGLGLIADTKGKVFLASSYYNRAIAILEANPSNPTITPRERIQVYLHMAQSTLKIGLYENTYDLAKKAETYLDSSLINDNVIAFRVYAQIFVNGMKKDLNQESLEYYLNKTKETIHSLETQRFYYLYKGNFFSKQFKLDSAETYFNKALAMNKNELKNDISTLENTYVTYCYLLKNTIKKNKKSEADSIITKIEELEKNFSKNLSFIVRLEFRKSLMNYYSQFKDFDKYQETSKLVLDLTEERQRKAELQAKKEMQAMYELSEKKKAINQLNQDVEIKENQLQRIQFFLAITILAILVILAILALFYYRQKNRKLQQDYEKVVLEQKLLRTQMEPHFIFNTLSTLQSLIRFQEPKVAIDYLNKFSRLLRSNLELSRKEMISLEDEIETIHNYLQLQQARFKDYFTYQIQTPDELEVDALLIPPMLIQPFVENSILHGFDGESEWHLDIKITELAETNQLQIDIIDNGVGINSTSKKTHKSLSGEIAKERLEILSKKYKIPTDYQISSEQGKGTKVCLKLPIIDMSNV